MINVRDKILELVEMGLSKDDVILACLKYMSVDEVKDMALYNGFLSYDDFDDNMRLIERDVDTLLKEIMNRYETNKEAKNGKD
jgi:hypothetical protein